GFFDAVAAGVSRRLEYPARFLLVLMLATAGLSAFLNHDIVCFVFTPIIAEALSRRQLDPVPFLVALAVASNIGAGATLVGNPQGMMIAQIAGLAFAPYAAWSLVPVLFALGGAYAIIWLLSRRGWGDIAAVRADTGAVAQPLDRAHTVKGLVILVLVIGLFFTTLPKEIVALTAAGIHLASPKFRTKELLGLVDWPILVLFMSLFVVTGVFQATGYGDQAVLWLAHRGFELSAPPNLVWVTATLSNLISNSAAVMLLLKVAHLSGPVAAYALALANSFGGSLLIIGSVSNIIVVHQARERGIILSFWNFARLGIPITLVALGGLIGWEMLMRS
ncbi:MAG TPA: SLC13 family permease, partial [Opitutaceae bacterium]|nr:SLC13 family permease [Opitutaceae bacterium]